jgi:hypothetical protein
MPYLVFDTETTGLPDWRQPADAPGALTDAKACLRLLRYMVAHDLCRAEAA